MGEETKQEEAKSAETKVEEKKEEEKKDEEKKEEKKEVDKKEEEKKEEEKNEKEATPPPPPPPPPVILSVDLHCVGCAKKIERCLLKCKGVEEVEIDMGQDQLKIKGVVDPQALCSRIQKKTLRSAKVISPVLPEEADSAKPQVVASQVSGVTTVELHVNMHCEACAQQLRRKILKMRGVQAAEADLSSGKVMVTGTMTGDKISDYIYRRTGKLAKVIPPTPPPPPPSEEEKKDEGEKKPEDPKPEEEKKEENPAEEKKEENAEKKEDEKSPPDGKKEEGGKEAKKEGDQLAQANMQYTGPDPDMFKRMMYWNNGGGGYDNDSYMGEDNYNYYGKRMPVPWVAPGMPAVYVIERPPPPPQLFSDENPNACCIS